MFRPTIILLFATAIAAPAAAQFKPIDGHINVSREAIEIQYQEKLQTLRREALAQRIADGGTLTPAHIAVFQSRLNQLDSDYRLASKNADPWSVNADGSRRY